MRERQAGIETVEVVVKGEGIMIVIVEAEIVTGIMIETVDMKGIMIESTLGVIPGEAVGHGQGQGNAAGIMIATGLICAPLPSHFG